MFSFWKKKLCYYLGQVTFSAPTVNPLSVISNATQIRLSTANWIQTNPESSECLRDALCHRKGLQYKAKISLKSFGPNKTNMLNLCWISACVESVLGIGENFKVQMVWVELWLVLIRFSVIFLASCQTILFILILWLVWIQFVVAQRWVACYVISDGVHIAEINYISPLLYIYLFSLSSS